MLKASIFLTLIFVLVDPISCGITKDRVVVYGELLCDGQPFRDATLKLYDTDPIKDDFLAKTTSTMNGSFYLDGSGRDILKGKIDPRLYIYHKCNKGFFGCKRENRFDIPQAYVVKASDPNPKPFYVGRIELMMKPKTETTKCLPVGKK